MDYQKHVGDDPLLKRIAGTIGVTAVDATGSPLNVRSNIK